MVVVGGGLLGVSAAYHLALAGAAPVLLDTVGVGAGATGASAGMLVPGFAWPYPHVRAQLGAGAARAAYAWTVRNVALVRELVERERIDCALAPGGMLTLGLGDEQCAAGRALAALLQADGFGVRVVERAELGELIDTPVADHVGGGLLQTEAGSVDPTRLVSGLATAAGARGARIVAGVRVAAVDPTGDGVTLQTSAGRIGCAAAVLAVNAWTPRLWPAPAPALRPMRAQMLAYPPVERVFRVPVTAAVSAHGEYWRQTSDGALVVGGRRDLDRDAETTTQEPSAEVQRGIEQILPALFPRLRLPGVRSRWAGAIALTPDGLPLAGAVPGRPGVWMGAGCNGHGLAMAVALGQALATAVGEGRVPAALTPFDPTRLRPGPG